ncbi:methyltransferase [Arsenophonus sp.]|uniref:methyltransferase n=1 Tax=Arsenophonus sp. TaxID=1872640 RepID=UPI002866A564|nr:methyltransferase [Arsenophonus sp.]MDR5617810.1 methyltransferase [Arsenophonus sp.]MDR5617831.1 methyltransferase [Arsenophonus sp.]
MNSINWQNTHISPCGTFHVLGNTPIYAFRFNKIMKYHEPGLAAVEDESGAYHIDIHGYPYYTRRFLETYGFYESLAAVRDRTGCFHIKPNGQECYSNRYLWCGNFQEGLCTVRDQINNYFHINHKGMAIYTEKYAYVGDFKDGVAVVCSKNGLHTHINTQGKLLHKNWFLGLDVFHKDQARAKDKQGWHHINKLGRSLYPQRYAQVEPFYNGVSYVETFLGELLTIDNCGHIITQISPHIQQKWQKISEKLVGFWQTETLAIAARLRVLDGLPGTTEEIAKKIKLPSTHLERLLRALWELDFVKNKTNLWILTENGKAFITHKDNFLSCAAIMWSDVNRIAWKKLLTIISEGKHQSHTLFKVSASNKNLKIYNHAIDGYAKEDFSILLTLIDWQQHKEVIGIGRSAHKLLEQALITHKHLQALLLGDDYIFHNIAINPLIKLRYKLQSQVLWHPWQKMADAILIPRALHYWPDKEAISILQKAKNSLSPNGKIYLIELIIDEKIPYGALLDLNMLAESGGKLRTLNEWEILFQKSSLSMLKHIKISDNIDLLILTNNLN